MRNKNEIVSFLSQDDRNLDHFAIRPPKVRQPNLGENDHDHRKYRFQQSNILVMTETDETSARLYRPKLLILHQGVLPRCCWTCPILPLPVQKR